MVPLGPSRPPDYVARQDAIWDTTSLAVHCPRVDGTGSWMPTIGEPSKPYRRFSERRPFVGAHDRADCLGPTGAAKRAKRQQR